MMHTDMTLNLRLLAACCCRLLAAAACARVFIGAVLVGRK